MAYCLKCGAYIPDGQSGCLACGYDPEEEKKKAEAESTARSRGGSAAAAQKRLQGKRPEKNSRREIAAGHRRNTKGVRPKSGRKPNPAGATRALGSITDPIPRAARPARATKPSLLSAI